MRINITYNEKLILNSLNEGILIIDNEGTVLFINDAYKRITQTNDEEILGQPLYKVRPGSKLSDVVKTGQAILRAPRYFNNIEYMTNMCPIKDDEGQTLGGISSIIEMDEIYRLNQELERFKSKLAQLEQLNRRGRTAKYSFEDIVFADPESGHIIQLAKRMSKRDASILITGESGTGKELYANSIHNESERSRKPFVAVNCATFDSNLLESELFGYEEGAFTGAKKGGKAGLFKITDGGTIFLDEIAELDYKLQARLLRVLQEGTIRPLGSKKEVKIDVRVIAATNKDLLEMIKKKQFREDLYYRIAVIPLHIPPLRQRKQDILPLVQSFLKEIIQQDKMVLQYSPEALRLLENYDWPGNIRELKNAVNYSSFLAEDNAILPIHLPLAIQAEGMRNNMIYQPKLKDVVKNFEVREIKKVLAVFGDTLEGKKKAAKYLGISLATLYNKLEC